MIEEVGNVMKFAVSIFVTIAIIAAFIPVFQQLGVDYSFIILFFFSMAVVIIVTLIIFLKEKFF